MFFLITAKPHYNKNIVYARYIFWEAYFIHIIYVNGSVNNKQVTILNVKQTNYLNHDALLNGGKMRIKH